VLRPRYFGIPKSEASLRELRTPILNKPENGQGFRKESVLVEAQKLAMKIHGKRGRLHRFVSEIQSKDYKTREQMVRLRTLTTASFLRGDENLEARSSAALVLSDLQWVEDFPHCFAMKACTPFP